jgi:hypothetical protein
MPDRFGPFFKLHCQQASARFIELCNSSMLLGHNVLDVETPFKKSVRNQTIFAAMTGSLTNLCVSSPPLIEAASPRVVKRCGGCVATARKKG